MTEQWQELKETIIEMRDNDGTGTQQDACKFLANYMEILEKQMREPCDDCTVIKKLSKKYYVEDAYGYTDEGIVNKVNEIIDAVNESSSTPQIEPCEDCISREAVRKVLSNEVFELMKLHSVNPKDNPKADAMAHGVNWSLNTLMELPSVTPQKPKGKWIKIQSGNEDFPESIVCSRCKNENSHLDFDEHSEPIGKIFVTSKYCPNCGAEMSGGEEDAT